MTAQPVDPSVDTFRLATDTEVEAALLPDHAALLTSKAVNLPVAVAEETFSVTRPEQMPHDLKWVFERPRKCAKKIDASRCHAPAAFGPGIIYTWRNQDGQVRYQFNPTWGVCDEHGAAWLPTNSDEQPVKYLFEPGPSIPLWVAKSMIERIKTAKNILFVEGTKQYLAVVSALLNEEDWLVVGIAGCQNWRSGGIPNAHIDELAADRSGTVAVAFDSDVLTNESVFDAGKALDLVLVAASGRKGCYLKIPVNMSAGNGVDDWLGSSVKPARRTTALLNQLTNADTCKALPAKFPGKRRVTVSDDDADAELFAPTKVKHALIDIEAGWVKVPDTRVKKDGYTEIKEGPIVAGFVPRIVRSYVVGDLHNITDRDVFHDIEVTQNGVVYEAINVSDAQIGKREGFDRLLRSMGMTAPAWVSDPYSHAQVLAAMRADSEINAVKGEAMSHTGWWDHPELGPVFLVPGGGISADGWITERKTMFERGSNRSKIDLCALETATQEEIRKAVETANEIFDAFDPEHQTFPLLLISQIALAASGLMSRGTPYVIGKRASGKSATVECGMTFYGRGIDPEVMIDQTGRKAVSVGYGLSNVMIALDDIKPTPADPEAYKATVKGVHGNSRRGYDGAKAGSSSMQMSDTSRTGWAPGQPEQTDPFFIMTGEIVPPELDPSTLERLFIHQHLSQHLRNGKRLNAIAGSGILALANAAYIQHTARSIVAAGGMGSWMLELIERSEALVEAYESDFPTADGPSKRTALVLGHRLIGASLWAAFCVEVGVWSEEYAERWEDAAVDTLVAAMHWHFDNYGTGSSSKSNRWIIDAVKNAVAGSPRWFIATSLATGITKVEQGTERRTMIGCGHSLTHDGESREYIALSGVKVAEALGMKSIEVEAALKTVAEPRLVKGSKRYTRPIKALNTSVSFYWIPREVWDAEADDIETPDNVVSIKAAG